jgi:hypothetical protein
MRERDFPFNQYKQSINANDLLIFIPDYIPTVTTALVAADELF